MRRRLRFLLGHAPRELDEVEPTLTVLEYLRRTERRCGTKEGCAEGDCGACTVVLGHPEGGRMAYRAVDACILLLPMLDGCQLLTVEDLRAPDGSLHPVQRAMVEAHASQCGFCTPGFVMALYARLRTPAGERPPLTDGLAGNLCRCTGYGPILAAGRRLEETPGGDHLEAREAETVALLERWRDGETLAVGRGGRMFYAPATAEALARLLLEHPGATLLGGATDVGLWITKQHRRPSPIVWTGRVRDLARVEETEEGLRIGAAATYREVIGPLASLYPDADAVLRRVGSVQIRNLGTVGGNIANGSPIGDSPPLLIAAGAELLLRRGEARRRMPLEDFFLAYGRQDRRPGEFVEAVVVPKPAPGTLFRAYKVSKRFDQDISSVCAAFRIDLDDGRVAAARLAYGGMAPVPKRATRAERALAGRPWSRATVEAAMAAMERDFSPIDDWRASAGYRMTVARNLLLRCWLESTGEIDRRLDRAPEMANA